MADVFTINSTVIDQTAWDVSLDRCVLYSKGGCPELHFSRPLPALITLPDAWSGKAVTVTTSSVLIFSGDVVGYIDRYMELGWVREYRALGLRNRADYIPVTDANTLTDTCSFNLPGDDPDYIPSRAGQTVGQIVQQVLEMDQNGTALSAAGLVNYASGPPWVLPTVTLTDLAALTVVPPWRVMISGERILATLESFVQGCHPNCVMYVDPSGNIRFLDLRTFTPNTLTLGGDPRLGMSTLTRDYSECYSQVEVRGNTLATAVTLQTLPWPGSANPDGGLQEDFTWGSFTTNAAAIAAWVPADWNQPSVVGNGNDTGSCTCPSTLTVTVTSSNPLATWAANFLAQGSGEALADIYLYADVITGVTQNFQARVVANTALTAGGTSTLTIDAALPALTYNSYQLFFTAANASLVWRRYKIANTAIGQAMLQYFPYPVPLIGAAGTSAMMTSAPTGLVWYSAGCTVPYNVASLGITLDPVNGLIYFDRPTALVFGGGATTPPCNVSVFLPIANGSLSTFYPSSTTYQGTLYTVEGIQRRKTITVRSWTDAGTTANMATYAQEYLESVQDVIVEGTLPYYGLLTTFLTMGQAVSIAGTSGSTSYVTGYESLNLPVISAELIFNAGPTPGTSYSMNLQLSNRRGKYSADQFLRPAITGMQFGLNDTVSLGGAGAGMGGSAVPGGVGGSGIALQQATRGPDPSHDLPSQAFNTGGPTDMLS